MIHVLKNYFNTFESEWCWRSDHSGHELSHVWGLIVSPGSSQPRDTKPSLFWDAHVWCSSACRCQISPGIPKNNVVSDFKFQREWLKINLGFVFFLLRPRVNHHYIDHLGCFVLLVPNILNRHTQTMSNFWVFYSWNFSLQPLSYADGWPDHTGENSSWFADQWSVGSIAWVHWRRCWYCWWTKSCTTWDG